jgi:hypothetical protein
MHLDSEDRTGVVYALEEAADGRGVGEVRGSRGASGGPPVRRLSMMSELYSPLAEKAPDLESNGG